jgi:hypothetical protein
MKYLANIMCALAAMTVIVTVALGARVYAWEPYVWLGCLLAWIGIAAAWQHIAGD